jgi:signal transduction histidine kinase
MAVSDPDATVETFRESCTQALEEGEHQERLIDALLSLAQGQRGIDQRELIDIAALTDDVLHAHEPDAAARGLHLDASLKPAFVFGDSLLIERLVSNLAENAIRHNAPGGQVHTVVGMRAGQAMLAITNTGPLVPAEEVERLLQPFQGLTPDRIGHRDGLGLGLSIVAAITAAHGAALDIVPRRNGGLEVEVRFPPVAGGERAAQDGATSPRQCIDGVKQMPTIDPSLDSRRATVWPHGSSRAG